MWASRMILLFFVIASLRFAYLQFIKDDQLQEEIIENRVREIVNEPERGKILDKNGDILAMSLVTFDIAVHPNLILSETHKENVSKLLSENIEGVNYDEVFKIVDGTSYWKRISKRVTPDVAKIIRQSDIGGIQISQSPKRLYPNGSLGGTFLGFVNDNNQPGAGIEIKLNEFLGGTKGYTLAEITPLGEIIPVGSQNSVSPINGQDVQLTIDSYIQHLLEKRIAQAAEEMNPKEIHVVIMEPSSGKVRAVASYPSYEPTNYGESDPSTWTNTPANFVYEPGSIIKPIFMANAFELGAIDGTEMYNSGSKRVSTATISDWNRVGWGRISAKEIIQHSSNVGMIEIADKMTNEQIVNFLKEIGFNRTTGIELPGEEKGINFPTASVLDDDPIRKATISFGQGIAITPFQMITAFSEVINGGYDIEPTLIEKVTDNNGNLMYKPDKSTFDKMYSDKTSQTMKEYLKFNMEEGSGATAQIEGYDAGGKTGSAWLVENGLYKKGAIIGSFMGFIPYENPKYSILISVVEPEGVEYGSTAANPIFKDLMSEVMRYDGITPTVTDDEDYQPKSFQINDYKWYMFDKAKNTLESQYHNDIEVKKEGKGKVVIDQTYSYKNGKLLITLKTKPLKDKNSYYIPSFVGMPKEEAEKILSDNNIPNRSFGNGIVVEQNIEIGHHYDVENFQLWYD